MSVPVAVADLADALEDFGPGYLLSTTEGRVKVVSVEPALHDGVLVVRGPGRGTNANVAENPTVSLVFPPRAAHGMTLLVDGAAAIDGEDVLVTPASAVLHRPAAGASGS